MLPERNVIVVSVKNADNYLEQDNVEVISSDNYEGNLTELLDGTGEVPV